MSRKVPSYSHPVPPAVPVDATFSKAPQALHGMLRNPYRQGEVVRVAVVPQGTDLEGRKACLGDLATVGMTDVRDHSLRDDAVLWAAGTVASVRACLQLPSVRQVSLRAGPLR